MLSGLVRLIKRLLVFLPGLFLAYIAIFDIYPVLSKLIPSPISLLITYLITAYILIPSLLRVIRIVFPPAHFPHYSVTPDGFASDPVNIIIFGSEKSLKAAFKKAGWYQADPKNIKSILRLLSSILLRREYRQAPFSNLYLLGRKQDIGFQKPIDNHPYKRHHVRFWHIKKDRFNAMDSRVKYWLFHNRPGNNKTIWLGAPSRDIGLGIIKHNAQITHMIHSDTNTERDLIIKDLGAANVIKSHQLSDLTEPYTLTNRVISGYLESDGKVAIITL